MSKSVCPTLWIGLAVTSMMLRASSPTQAQPQAGGSWVPYRAQYREVTAATDKSGHQTQTVVLTEETRALDGSLLTVKKENGRSVSGTLWQACGRILSLDYQQRRAIFSRNAPREHGRVPSASPTGLKTIGGVPCDVYPLLSVPSGMTGSGSICVDQVRDIMVQVEMHLDSVGLHQDYVRQLESIDFNSPVDPALMAVPQGFTLLLPDSGTSGVCTAK
jgi:hypothetical protein